MNGVGEWPVSPGAGSGAQRRMPTAGEMLEHIALLSWLAHCRTRSAEYLHAQHYLSSAVDEVLRMLKRFSAGDELSRLCYFMPRRRLGSVAPELQRELLAIALGTVAVPEAALLDLLERRIRPHTPQLDWREVTSVRARMLTGRRDDPAG